MSACHKLFTALRGNDYKVESVLLDFKHIDTIETNTVQKTQTLFLMIIKALFGARGFFGLQ